MVGETARNFSSVRPSVLIAEDIYLIWAPLEERLNSYGVYVKIVTRADAAVEACRKHRFDVISMDGDLNGTSGSKAIRGIRAIYPEIPIVVFSAYAPETANSLRDLEGITYLDKGLVDINEWGDAVEGKLRDLGYSLEPKTLAAA